MPRTRGISHILDLNFQMDIIRTGENVHHTLSSLLLIALNEALKEVQEHGIAHLHKHYLHLKSEVTKRFSALGLTPLEGSNSPIVTSFRKPNGKTGAWPHISEILAKNKVNVYDNVAYLNEKDLFQIATMGPAYRLDHIEKLEGAFKQALQLSV
jgi:aspartate aminotransferase-like enzyme